MTRVNVDAWPLDPERKRDLVLVGHSHACALSFGTMRGCDAPTLKPIDGLTMTVQALDGPWPRPDDYWNTLLAMAPNKTIIIVWAGAQHMIQFLFASTSPFDFYLAEHPQIPLLKDATIVPEALVREALGQEARDLDALLARFKSIPGCMPVVLGTPPAKGNDERLRNIILKEPHHPQLVIWAKRLGLDLEAITFTDALVRQKLWIVLQDLLKETAATADCTFVPVPADAQDAAGFLKEEYWENDVLHANSAYGRLFWQKLEVFPADAR